MIEDPPLLTLKKNINRPTDDQVSAIAKASTGVLVDCLGGRGAMCASIKPIDDSGSQAHGRICGVALTCDAGPADNLAVFGALHMATSSDTHAGDVLVIATDGFQATAVIGDLVLGMAKNNGLSAVVTDGCVRDLAGCLATGLPCYASGVTPNSPARSGPGTAGFPITIGGITVATGDVVFGDADGVVVVPFERIDEVLDRLDDVLTAEATLDRQVAEGLNMPEFAKVILDSDRVIWSD